MQLYSAGELLEVQILDEMRGDLGRSGETDASLLEVRGSLKPMYMSRTEKRRRYPSLAGK